MENSTGSAGKKSTKTGKNDKTKEKRWNMLRQKEKSNKNNNKTRGNKLESTSERRKIKQTSTKDKTILTKKDISKQRNKLLPTTWRR